VDWLGAHRIASCDQSAGHSVRLVESADEWNQQVLRLEGALEQGYEWGEVLRRDGWTPHRYAVYADAACIAGVSIMAKRLPGTPYSVLYAPRGPMWDGGHAMPWDEMGGAIRHLAASTRAIFLRLSPNALGTDPGVHQQLIGAGFRALDDDWTTWNAPRIVLRLDLKDSEPELFRRIRKSTRSEIRAAAEQGVIVRRDGHGDTLHHFHRMLVETGRRKRYPIRSIRRLGALWHEYVRRDNGVLLMAYRGDTPVGGVLGVRFGPQASFVYAAIRRDGDAARLDHGPLLYWEFIRWARDAGVTWIDWGGSGTRFPPSPADPGYGVYHFKSNFGSRLHRLIGYYDLVFHPRLYRMFRTVEARLLPHAWGIRAKLNPMFGWRRR
jgi:lipid II:glycine glycyltransferase (peptidoglycan interpeptide bridge formation enzyme)